MTDLIWTTEKRNIKDLKEYPNNPRTLTKQQEKILSDSLNKFGYVEAIAIDQDNTILAGHMRVKVLKKNKVKEIDVRVPNRPLTEEERHQYVIASNKVTGDWDFDALANNWDAADLVSWGFDAKELFQGLEDSDISTNKESKDKKSKEHTCPGCGLKFL